MNEFLTNTSELKTLKRVWPPLDQLLYLLLERATSSLASTAHVLCDIAHRQWGQFFLL